MRTYLTYTVFGIFLFDEESRVLAKEITYPNLEKSVETVKELNSGNITDLFRNVVGQINGEGPTVVLTQELAGAISSVANVSPGWGISYVLVMNVEPVGKTGFFVFSK